MSENIARPDPYDICPVYESERLRLRLVVPEDAADIEECYRDCVKSLKYGIEK